MCSGKHVQAPAPFCSRQIAFAPQGDGTQGRVSSTTGSKKEREKNIISHSSGNYYNEITSER
jgi:hypothetical protein